MTRPALLLIKGITVTDLIKRTLYPYYHYLELCIIDQRKQYLILNMTSSQGIQTLLEAEKEAAKVVQKARQYRVQKLKDARAEAAKEIEAYRAQKDKDFTSFESEHKSQTKDSQETIDKDTEKQVETLKTDVDKNRSAVIDKILERVIQNDPQLHQNLKKVEA